MTHRTQRRHFRVSALSATHGRAQTTQLARPLPYLAREVARARAAGAVQGPSRSVLGGRDRGSTCASGDAPVDMRGGAQRAHPPSRGTRARTGAQSSVQFSTGALVRAPQLRGARLPLPICPLRRRFCPASRHAAQARGRRSEEAGSPSTRRRHDLEGWLAEAPPARPERARDDRVARMQSRRPRASRPRSSLDKACGRHRCAWPTHSSGG